MHTYLWSVCTNFLVIVQTFKYGKMILRGKRSRGTFKDVAFRIGEPRANDTITATEQESL